MKYPYKDYVEAHLGKFKKVIISEDCQKKIQELAEKVAEKKKCEKHHQEDCYNEIKRFRTGFLGEAALEQLLGIKVINWTVGESKNYNNPDIPGYKVGIKSVEMNKYPIIFKKNWYPQIMCIVDNKTPGLVYVCGLATSEVLNKYQDTELILSPALKARGTKTGFYGYEHLLPVETLEDIKDFKK